MDIEYFTIKSKSKFVPDRIFLAFAEAQDVPNLMLNDQSDLNLGRKTRGSQPEFKTPPSDPDKFINDQIIYSANGDETVSNYDFTYNNFENSQGNYDYEYSDSFTGRFNLNSSIYEFNYETKKFELFQEIPTKSCLDIEYFLFGNEHYWGEMRSFVIGLSKFWRLALNRAGV